MLSTLGPPSASSPPSLSSAAGGGPIVFGIWFWAPQFHHVDDIVPTICEILGITAPRSSTASVPVRRQDRERRGGAQVIEPGPGRRAVASTARDRGRIDVANEEDTTMTCPRVRAGLMLALAGPVLAGPIGKAKDAVDPTARSPRPPGVQRPRPWSASGAIDATSARRRGTRLASTTATGRRTMVARYRN